MHGGVARGIKFRLGQLALCDFDSHGHFWQHHVPWGAGELTVRFNYQRLLNEEPERQRLEDTLQDYMALGKGGAARVAIKRGGRAKELMLESLARMAMLFAAAKMGTQEEFEDVLAEELAAARNDSEASREMRLFYAQNAGRVPGTGMVASERLDQAMRLIEVMPLTGVAENQ